MLGNHELAAGSVVPVIASNKSCAWNLEAPGLAPLGKACKHFNTMESSTVKGLEDTLLTKKMDDD